MSAKRAGDEDVLLTRVTRSFAVRSALLVAAGTLLLIGIVTGLVIRAQNADANTTLRTTAVSADDVVDPPADTWLLISDAQGLHISGGLPEQLIPRLSALRSVVPADGRVALTNLSGTGHGGYRVATVHTGSRIVQVVLSLRAQQQQRERLLHATSAAALVALALAAVLGIYFGRRAARPLAQALALQRTFVADASHELRTPLTLLSTRAQLLQRSLASGVIDEATRQDADGVVKDAQRLSEVLDDLLVAADPAAHASLTPIVVGDLIASVIESAEAHAEQQGVRLIHSPATEELSVVGTEAALRRGLLALIDNAIDHTPGGGSVSVSVERIKRRIVVAVTDTGPGVPLEQQSQIMRRFHSGAQRGGRSHYGLGLALTHDVALRHGGELRLAHSTQGARFELVLPAPRSTGRGERAHRHR